MSKNPRPKTAKFKKQGGGTNLTNLNESVSKASSIYKQDSAMERDEKQEATQWNLQRLNVEQMRILNEKLDEF